MKRFAFAFLVLIFSATSSHAAVVIDPATGLTSSFSWSDGLAPIDDIDGSGENEWSISVAEDSILTEISVSDLFVPGDEFELIFDGNLIDWTTSFIDGGGFFNGVLDNLFLSAGLHTFTLNLTTLAAGFTSGGATASFSGVTPSTVPVPAAAWLFGSALLGFFGLRRKQSKAAV